MMENTKSRIALHEAFLVLKSSNRRHTQNVNIHTPKASIQKFSQKGVYISNAIGKEKHSM